MNIYEYMVENNQLKQCKIEKINRIIPHGKFCSFIKQSNQSIEFVCKSQWINEIRPEVTFLLNGLSNSQMKKIEKYLLKK